MNPLIGVLILAAVAAGLLIWVAWVHNKLKETEENLAWEIRDHDRVCKDLAQAKEIIEDLHSRKEWEHHRRLAVEYELQKAKTAVSRIGWNTNTNWN